MRQSIEFFIFSKSMYFIEQLNQLLHSMNLINFALEIGGWTKPEKLCKMCVCGRGCFWEWTLCLGLLSQFLDASVWAQLKLLIFQLEKHGLKKLLLSVDRVYLLLQCTEFIFAQIFISSYILIVNTLMDCFEKVLFRFILQKAIHS